MRQKGGYKWLKIVWRDCYWPVLDTSLIKGLPPMNCGLGGLSSEAPAVRESPQLPVSEADPNDHPRILSTVCLDVGAIWPAWEKARQRVWAEPGPPSWQPSAWEGPGPWVWRDCQVVQGTCDLWFSKYSSDIYFFLRKKETMASSTEAKQSKRGNRSLEGSVETTIPQNSLLVSPPQVLARRVVH